MRKEVLLFVFSAFFLFLAVGIVSASLESDFMSLMNSERARLGKQPVYINANLSNAGYLHSKDMGDNNYFSHTSLDRRTFDQRIKNSGYVNYRALGENIAYASGSPDASLVYNMWKNSPGHYANMVSGSFNEAGLGIYSINSRTYYTLDFGSRFDFTPISSPTIPLPVQANTSKIFSSISVTKSGSVYQTLKATGSLSQRAYVSYFFLGKEYRICSYCTSFTLYLTTQSNPIQIQIKAKNNQGQTDIRSYAI